MKKAIKRKGGICFVRLDMVCWYDGFLCSLFYNTGCTMCGFFFSFACDCNADSENDFVSTHFFKGNVMDMVCSHPISRKVTDFL